MYDSGVNDNKKQKLRKNTMKEVVKKKRGNII